MTDSPFSLSWTLTREGDRQLTLNLVLVCERRPSLATQLHNIVLMRKVRLGSYSVLGEGGDEVDLGFEPKSIGVRT